MRGRFLIAVIACVVLSTPAAAGAASWTIAPALTTTDTTSSLAAVSCSGRDACTAVGSDAGGMLVVREGAGGWSIQGAPNPDGATAASITAPGLTAVSCPTANECVAVGSYTTPGGNTAAFAELWNGTSWSLQPTPKTHSDASTSLSAITCPSPAECVAAGTQTIGVGEPMSHDVDTDRAVDRVALEVPERPTAYSRGRKRSRGCGRRSRRDLVLVEQALHRRRVGVRRQRLQALRGAGRAL